MELRRIPKDPTQADWPPEVITDRCTCRTISRSTSVAAQKRPEILVASYEGVSLLVEDGDKWDITPRSARATRPSRRSNRGSSEIKLGKLKSGTRYIATIEPWHGNQVVVYTQPAAREGVGRGACSTTS